MSQHVADRILAAVVAQLAAAGLTVFVEPHGQIVESDMPCIRLRGIEDEVISSDGFDPVFETHELTFDAFCCDMAGTSGLRAAVGDLRTAVEVALLGTADARKLGGLLTRGIKRLSAAIDIDSDTLQKPVGGWSIRFVCTYGLHSDAPWKVEKE